MITVLHNQSLLDVAIQHTGSVMNVFSIAKANGMAVSDEIVAGAVLEIPTVIFPDNNILNYYQNKNIKPATAITATITGGNPQAELEGIDYWAISDDFIVQ